MTGRVVSFRPRRLQRVMNTAETPTARLRELLRRMTPHQQVLLTNLALAMVEAGDARAARIDAEKGGER